MSWSIGVGFMWAPMLGLETGGFGGDNSFGFFGTGGSDGGTLGAPGTVGGPGPLDALGPSVSSAGRFGRLSPPSIGEWK